MWHPTVVVVLKEIRLERTTEKCIKTTTSVEFRDEEAENGDWQLIAIQGLSVDIH